MHYAIFYVSTLAPGLSESEVNQILKSAENYNNENDITGLLLYSEGNFLQVLEGEKEKVETLFNRIKADERHENVIVIFSRAIHRASYDGYKSDFVASEKKYNEDQLREYYNHIHVLDAHSQQAVKNLVRAFVV